MTTFAFVIPAFEAAKTVGEVVRGLRYYNSAEHDAPVIIVVDDGSRDETSPVAAKAGAIVLRHAANRGKGAALRTGFQKASELALQTVITVDADAQHPSDEAWKLARHEATADTLVLGVRDLDGAGAPQLNRTSNRISNFFLSRFGRRAFADTQCGLRRYPLERVLRCGATAGGYAYESEILLIAALQGWSIEEVPVRVIYPPEAQRVTHFHNVKDPARIVGAVLKTLSQQRR